MLKIDNLKFFQCPLSYITPRSWRILDLVVETTSGETGEILHLPYSGSYLEQPAWYREAVKIRRNERLSTWFNDLMERKAKDKANGR